MIAVQWHGDEWESAMQKAYAILITHNPLHKRFKLQQRALAAVILWHDPYLLPVSPYTLDMEVNSLVGKGLIYLMDSSVEEYALTWRAEALLQLSEEVGR